MKGFIRFQQIDDSRYFALVSPQYDVLPLIRFRDLATFEVDNDDLADITIITDDLNEAATFLVDGDGDETLIIQGSDAEDDDYTVSLDGSGNVQIAPGYDGEFGTIKIFGEGERTKVGGQTTLF